MLTVTANENGTLLCDVYFADGEKMYVPDEDLVRFNKFKDHREEMIGSCHAGDLDSKRSYNLAAHGRDLSFRGTVGNVFVWFEATKEGSRVRLFDESKDEEHDI